TVFLLAGVCPGGLAYPTGAPLQACADMKPLHPPTTTSGQAPFAIKTSTLVYTPGAEITGTIYSPSGVKFRGLLMEVLKTDNTSTDPVGTFDVVDNNTQTQCGQGSKQGLTHVSNSNKTSVTFKWIAPSAPAGDIRFRLSVVESYDVSRYWLGIFSATVQDCSIHPTIVGCKGSPTPPLPASSSARPSSISTLPPTKSTQSPVITSPAQSSIPYDPACGKTKGCFPDASRCSSGCHYLVTWGPAAATDESDIIAFNIKMMLDDMSDVWMAVGLSKTGKMDKTTVAACLTQGGQSFSLSSSYNNGHANVPFSNPTMGLSGMDASVSGKVFSCSFTRLRAMNETNFWNISDPMYILVGTGPVANGLMSQHMVDPVSSSAKINFTAFSIIGEGDRTSILIKAHGALMTVAWLFFSSVGIVVARHCKSILEHKLLLKHKSWFLAHRTMMTLAALCVIAAVVAIFVERKGFSKIVPEVGKEYTKAHPFLGIVVAALTVINPIMALFRPAPESKKRYIFNWAHFFVGTSAHILAVINVFFGCHLSAAHVDKSSALYLMVAYVAAFVAVYIIFEIHNRCSKSSMFANGTAVLNNPVAVGSGSSLMVFMLVFHVLMMAAVSFGLLFLILWPNTTGSH
ncbi:FRRS1-like protein, partial [Mya arenaria]